MVSKASRFFPGLIMARRKLEKIQVMNRKFSFQCGDLFVGVKEVDVLKLSDSVKLLNFAFELLPGIDKRFALRSEIVRRIRSAKKEGN